MKTTFDKQPVIVTAGEILLPALSVLFGLQILRAAIPQMVWLFGDRFGMNAAFLGIIALAVFSFSFLTGILRKIRGNDRLILFSAFGLGLARLLVQVQWPEPLAGMLLSLTGILFFGVFMSAYLDKVRAAGKAGIGNLVTGLLAGLLFDTALHGAFRTYDMAWQPGILPLILTIILVFIHCLAVYSLPFRKPVHENAYGVTWPWLALGPFLFLQLVVFQNIARLSVLTGWPQPYVYGWILLSQIAGLSAAVCLMKTNRYGLSVSILAGIAITAATAFSSSENPLISALSLFIGQVTASVLFTLLLNATVTVTTDTAPKSINAPNGTGFVLLGALTLAYYTGYQITLPYENPVLEPAAAFIMAVCGIIAAARASSETAPLKTSWLLPGLSLLFLVLPLTSLLIRQEPETISGPGFPVRLMTYNLHNGFNTDGDLDLEALTLVIEEANPDIVVLQEISRGWLISGRTDMLDWLSQRLDMPYVSGPTEGALWGSAVLSRFPVIESGNYELPPRDLFLRRGYLSVRFDIGEGKVLNVIATHLHHLEEDSAIRQQQVPVILDAWNNQEYTVITGDMNARPDTREMAMFRDAGLTDVMAGAVPPEGFTFRSSAPYERIDYIWITPDLKVNNAGVINSTASDHLPVIVELTR